MSNEAETVLKNGHSQNGDLKKFSSTEDLTEPKVLTNSEPEHVLNKENVNGIAQITEDFINIEKQNGQNVEKTVLNPESDDYENNENLGLEISPDETVFQTTETAKDRFMSAVTDLDESDPQGISTTAKDRLFLASDSACLFFNHRVVQSPMLTPTEENCDFLQGISNSGATPPDDSSPKENLSESLNEPVNEFTDIQDPDYTNPPENDSLADRFDSLYLKDDSIQNIQDITTEFIEMERRSADCSFDKSESFNYEIDGEIPVLKITEVTPEYEEKEFFVDNEKSIENVDELPLENEPIETDLDDGQETVETRKDKTQDFVCSREDTFPKEEENAVIENCEPVCSPTISEDQNNCETKNTENFETFQSEESSEKCDNQVESEVSDTPKEENLNFETQNSSVNADEGSENQKTECNDIFDIVKKTKELFEEKANPPENSFVPKSYNLIKRLDVSPNRNEDDEVFEINNTSTNFFVSVFCFY